MNGLLAQAQELNIWNAPSGSTDLILKIILTFVVGIILMIAIMNAPQNWRRPLTWTFTFVGGLFWMVEWLWPKAPQEAMANPTNTVDGVSAWITNATPVISGFTNNLLWFILCLGVWSLVSIHSKRIIKQQKDWKFSVLLLISLVAMVIFGYWGWYTEEFSGIPADELAKNPTFALRAKDLLFDGMFQQMEAGMFSIIAFFILSAAYRAFRVRSVESTILLGTALIVMLSLMGAIVVASGNFIDVNFGGSEPGSFAANFKLENIREWISSSLQSPAIRGIQFGIWLGALAMGIRLWLGLERAGGKN